MPSSKVTHALRQRLDEIPADAYVDVVVELLPTEAETHATTGLSRRDRAEVHRQRFLEAVAPVERWILGLGGEVLGHAWINQTLRARVPAGRVDQLTLASGVASVDTPHSVTRD